MQNTNPGCLGKIGKGDSAFGLFKVTDALFFSVHLLLVFEGFFGLGGEIGLEPEFVEVAIAFFAHDAFHAGGGGTDDEGGTENVAVGLFVEVEKRLDGVTFG